MSSIAINGTQIYYEESGSGPSMLFIHGMCGDASVWSDQVRRMGQWFRCVSYDRRGHSRSPLGPVTQRTVELHADDAAALIRSLALEPCLVVGSSGGARIALDVARRYPDLLAGVVLSEPPVLSLLPDGSATMFRELKPRLEEAAGTGDPRAAVDAFFNYMCPGLWSAIAESLRDVYRNNAGEFFADLQMPPYQIDVDAVSRIAVPSLVIQGDRSHPDLQRVVGVLANRLPHAQSVVLAECGHVTYFEQPEAFARVVTEFARGITAASVLGAA